MIIELPRLLCDECHCEVLVNEIGARLNLKDGINEIVVSCPASYCREFQTKYRIALPLYNARVEEAPKVEEAFIIYNTRGENNDIAAEVDRAFNQPAPYWDTLGKIMGFTSRNS